MDTRKTTVSIFTAATLLIAAAVAQDQKNKPPAISHQPVQTAIRGQPLSVLAKVTDDSGSVKTVTLFYSLTKDAAPFRVPMKSSGTSMYYGTIPPSLMTDAESISYYIEALDYVDATSESPWYTVRIRDTSSKEKSETEARAPAPAAPVAPAAPKREGANLLGLGVIAGGAAAVLGGALLVAANKDSDDDGGGQGDLAGTYQGAITECAATNGAASQCARHNMTITIDSGGKAQSDSIRSGEHLESTVQNNRFTFTAAIGGDTNGLVGSIQYQGTVFTDGTISGDVVGDAESASNFVQYSGFFSASK